MPIAPCSSRCPETSGVDAGNCPEMAIRRMGREVRAAAAGGTRSRCGSWQSERGSCRFGTAVPTLAGRNPRSPTSPAAGKRFRSPADDANRWSCALAGRPQAATLLALIPCGPRPSRQIPGAAADKPQSAPARSPNVERAPSSPQPAIRRSWPDGGATPRRGALSLPEPGSYPGGCSFPDNYRQFRPSTSAPAQRAALAAVASFGSRAGEVGPRPTNRRRPAAPSGTCPKYGSPGNVFSLTWRRQSESSFVRRPGSGQNPNLLILRDFLPRSKWSSIALAYLVPVDTVAP